MVNYWKLSLGSLRRQACHYHYLLLNTVLELLATAIKQVRVKQNPLLYVDEMTVYIEYTEPRGLS